MILLQIRTPNTWCSCLLNPISARPVPSCQVDSFAPGMQPEPVNFGHPRRAMGPMAPMAPMTPMTPMACKARFCSTRSAWPNPTTIQASLIGESKRFAGHDLVMVEVFHKWQTCCWRICSCTCCARREGRRMFQGLNLEGIETVHSFLVTPKR